jgi:hypothetical protein
MLRTWLHLSFEYLLSVVYKRKLVMGLGREDDNAEIRKRSQTEKKMRRTLWWISGRAISQTVTGFSTRRLGFNPVTVHVGLEGDKMTPRHVFLPKYLDHSLSIIISRVSYCVICDSGLEQNSICSHSFKVSRHPNNKRRLI